jgi:predicted DNA-binding protein
MIPQKNTEIIAIRLPLKLRKEIELIAKKNTSNLSAVVRYFISKGLENQ